MGRMQPAQVETLTGMRMDSAKGKRSGEKKNVAGCNACCHCFHKPTTVAATNLDTTGGLP